LPADSKVTVPEVHLFDREAHAIIMDDAGQNSIPLKEFFKQGKATVDMAKEMGEAVGSFLGRVHKWGRGNKELCASVSGNPQAKKICAWYYYGRLRETLTGAPDVPKLLDPPLVVDEDDLKVVEALAEKTTKAMLEAEHDVSTEYSHRHILNGQCSSSWAIFGQETYSSFWMTKVA